MAKPKKSRKLVKEKEGGSDKKILRIVQTLQNAMDDLSDRMQRVEDLLKMIAGEDKSVEEDAGSEASTDDPAGEEHQDEE